MSGGHHLVFKEQGNLALYDMHGCSVPKCHATRPMLRSYGVSIGGRINILAV